MNIHPWLAGPARRLPLLAGAAVLAAVPLLAAACASGSTPHGHPVVRELRENHSHGIVLGDLPIPYVPGAAGAPSKLVDINVSGGGRFAIKVDTSDGPFWWVEQGRPDPRVARVAGQYNDGHCAAGLVGCRVPYFFTLIAEHPGKTTMTWVYHAPDCRGTPPLGGTACQAIVKVRFDITVS